MRIIDQIPRLMDAICENFSLALNSGPWSPKVNEDMTLTTHCNQFVNGVAKSLSYFSFWPSSSVNPMLANEIFAWVWSSSEWTNIDGTVAQSHANTGAFVIAVQQDEPHGHVCVIRPGTMTSSGKWNKMVPKCANVGGTVFLDKGVNYAFGEKEPAYFVLNSTLGAV
jgi:hypothetical protein